MKNIISIGDLHGLSVWKEMIFGDKYEKWRAGEDIKLKFDKIVFVGDYFDSREVSNVEMKQNILDLIHLKETLGNRVVLLLGNHDIQYIDRKHRCSGLRAEMWHDFHDIMRRYSDLFQVAYQYEDILWTHAGLTAGSWKNFKSFLDKNNIKYGNYAEGLNAVYEMNYAPLFYIGFARGGSSQFPGIFWADKGELLKDPELVTQIVGHTPVSSTETYVTGTQGNLGTHISFIDCIGKGGSPHLIDFSKMQQRPLKKMRYD
jgi:hypothetical protein